MQKNYITLEELKEFEIHPINNGFNTNNRDINFDTKLKGEFYINDLKIDFSRSGKIEKSEISIFSDNPLFTSVRDKGKLQINIINKDEKHLSQTKCYFVSKVTNIGWQEIEGIPANFKCHISDLDKNSTNDLFAIMPLGDKSNFNTTKIGMLKYNDEKLYINSIYDAPMLKSYSPNGYYFKKK